MFLETKRLRFTPLRRARRRGGSLVKVHASRALLFLGRRRDGVGVGGGLVRNVISKVRMRPDDCRHRRFLCSLILLARRPPHLVHVLQQSAHLLVRRSLDVQRRGARGPARVHVPGPERGAEHREGLVGDGFIPRERLEHGGLDERVHLGHGELVRRLIGDNPGTLIDTLIGALIGALRVDRQSSDSVVHVADVLFARFLLFLLIHLLVLLHIVLRVVVLHVLHVVVRDTSQWHDTLLQEPLVWHELRPRRVRRRVVPQRVSVGGEDL